MNDSQIRSTELARWARDIVKEVLGGPMAVRPQGAWTEPIAATFVTWRWSATGRLQGCIGTLEPRRGLVDDVAYHAIAAALDDPRTIPLSRPSQVDLLDVEISELSELEPIVPEDDSEEAALAALRPGVDGVVIAAHGRRGTFLPTMWEQLPERSAFLRALKDKAGLPLDAWDSSFRLWRYTVVKHVDPAVARAS